MAFRFPFALSLCVLLSRVASDNSSGSAVCSGTLRPLRSLREIKDKDVFVLHAESAKSAENYCLSCFSLVGTLVYHEELIPGRSTQRPYFLLIFQR